MLPYVEFLVAVDFVNLIEMLGALVGWHDMAPGMAGGAVHNLKL
jgi:hypothetical protein